MLGYSDTSTLPVVFPPEFSFDRAVFSFISDLPDDSFPDASNCARELSPVVKIKVYAPVSDLGIIGDGYEYNYDT